jgi:hypothetical protein
MSVNEDVDCKKPSRAGSVLQGLCNFGVIDRAEKNINSDTSKTYPEIPSERTKSPLNSTFGGQRRRS